MSDMIGLLVQVGVFILLLGLGLGVGGWKERRHLRLLLQRQQAMDHVHVTNLKSPCGCVENPQLVMGQVVIATDYFKTLATSLKNLFGGEMRQAQRLLTRARREALMRLIEQAHHRGLDEVYNVRFVFCNISQLRGKSGAMQVEMMAYATAAKRVT